MYDVNAYKYVNVNSRYIHILFYDMLSFIIIALYNYKLVEKKSVLKV